MPGKRILAALPVLLLLAFVAVGTVAAQTGPVVSDLVISTTDSSATLTFTTDEAATSVVDFGTTTSYDRQVFGNTLQIFHSVVLDTLAENTVYHYQLTVVDVLNDQTVLPDSTFHTDDVSGPVVTNLVITTTDTSATLTFDTDEPAASSLEFGLTSSYDSTIVDSTLSTSHLIVVDSLDESTLYHYALTVTDSLTNETALGDSTFQTLDVTPPLISGVVFSDTTYHTVRVQWTTDEPTTGYAEIGSFRSHDDTLRTSHDIVVDILTHRTQNNSKLRMMSGADYGISIVAFDSTGNSSSTGDFDITTKSYIEGPLPSGWFTSDVGPIILPGEATYDSVANGGMFRIVGSGNQLYFDEDDFHFTYANVTGDFIFTAQVLYYAGTLARNSKASTHFRENLTTGSRMFNQSVNFDDTDRLYYRIEADSDHVDIIRSDLQANPGDSIWVRLSRSGNTFTEHYSSDGVNWTAHGPSGGTNVKLPSQGLVGMTSLSRSANSYTEILYNNVLLELPADTIDPVLVDFNAVGNLDTLNIDFETNENVTAILEYGYFVPYSDSLISDTLIADNSFQLTGLDEGVEYNYRVVFTDAGGNVVVDQNRTYIWGTLPVELTSFTAIQADADVILNWTTASELNSTQFNVEVAPEGAEYSTIGFVEAAGQSTEELSYSFRVPNVEPGNYRFRLKHIDTEGVSTVSDEISILVTLTQKFTLSEIYPNPFNPTARFTLQVRDEQNVDVEVYDMLGRRVQVLHRGVVPSSSKETFEIDGSRLSSGLYIVRITGEQFADTRKITLLK